MKKIFAGIVLPTLAAAAVIGSGFSVWFFGENQVKASSNATVEVENLLRIGTLTVDSKMGKLHLDQTKGVRSAILAAPDAYRDGTNVSFDSTEYGTDYKDKLVAKGLYLESLTGFTGKISYASPTANKYFDNVDGVCKVQIKTTFKFEDGLKNYVGMKTDNSGKWDTSVDGEYTYTWDEADKEQTLPMGSDTASADFYFEYKAYDSTKQYVDLLGKDSKRDDDSYASTTAMKTAEPHNDAEYTFMKDAVEGKKLTIETVATIIEA